jgi:hypothetical protein
MKYQGTIQDVKAVQDSIQKTSLYLVRDKTGFAGGFGVEPSSLYSIKLSLLDKSNKQHEFLFYISFNYQHRDNLAELWIEDKHVGRMFKVFPDIMPLFCKLTPIILPEKTANIVQSKYQFKQEIGRV